MQTLIFMGSSREDIRGFPEGARRELGRQLLRIQHGLDPDNWKPMKTVGKGVREVRVNVKGQFRFLYVTNIGNAVYVLHAFQKKAQKTSPKDIELGQRRYRQIGC
ncbi:type II toxin-antitoxin system RelE/ParE family toxin [Ectothiorhodospira variabilis]|uniref:type II toxin-antitoxin system RelE/ParE family toxin n=1 Tax=Ectothiorhodospira variabilis TaxID=505694 RepID=UPI001EFA3445|nr:type II toxin-antitoxin system RelE/ParE family toxin [Ectothiorhodospira variabilis]MCG5493564.1 type II toxin-antitoxin system RelE/ParE family toxin [Ectothiorhodospira variabilis]MCG5502893.1 type II toxin-antitoxin system RelE/ParE family toxin [Ectothiorhodospira variabilis]MCG5506319.1 type II toxin-antitoxin system RelE/ParE family toxin [Ectothiorhodospira variabilis]